MYQKTNQQKKVVRKLIVVYTGMVAVIISIVCFIVMIVLGFGFDANKGQLEQYAFLYFGSSPSGATVSVNDKISSSKTPNKTSVSAGEYNIKITKNGYVDWQKSVNAKSGVISWLNYALLVPKNLKTEVVSNYDAVYSSLASPENRNLLIQGRADTPVFNIVDISSDSVKDSKLTIPADKYSESATVGVSHNFQIDKWDDGERYVLIKHTYGDKNEWLVLDTQDAGLTKNITKMFNISISDIDFSDNSGNKFYALDTNDIRKLDLAAGTMSKSLVTNVSSFDVSPLNVITFISKKIAGKDQQIAGIYLENNDKSYNLRTTNAAASLHIATAHYFKEDYVAISEGSKVDIFSGSYPSANNKEATSLTVVKTYNLGQAVDGLGFSPSGEYVLARFGSNFASYDLEYDNLYNHNVDQAVTGSAINWLDNNYLWSDAGGKLTIREFDGSNVHEINSVIANQTAALTHDKSYIYSINKSGEKYQLQRVRMILP